MNIEDKKMGMWWHEDLPHSIRRVHAYQTWRTDSNDGKHYDYRGSYGDCNCPPAPRPDRDGGSK